jgi:hypothetical protein
VLFAGLAALFVADQGDGARASASRASRPFVNARAFRHDGELAFVSRGAAWLLDGSRGALRRLPAPAGYVASSPSFSRDGRWLAYLLSRRPSSDSAGTFELWLARGDGSAAHQVRGLDVDQLVGWSTAADLLAVTVGSSTHVPYRLPTGLDAVSPTSRVNVLYAVTSATSARVGAIWSAVWSPAGNAVAVSTNGPAGTSIRAIPLARPAPARTWLSIPSDRSLPAICSGCTPDGVIANLAGWWPTWGIAFWIYSSGAVHNPRFDAAGTRGAAGRASSGARPDAVHRHHRRGQRCS